MKRTWNITLVIDADTDEETILEAIRGASPLDLVDVEIQLVETPLNAVVVGIDPDDTFYTVRITDPDTGAQWELRYPRDAVLTEEGSLDLEYIRERENPRRGEHQGEGS